MNELLKQHPECLFLAVTEHWKSEWQLKLYGLKHFKLASWFCREENKGGGGSAVYVRDGIDFQVRRSLNKIAKSEVFECAAIECTVQNICFIIISVYRTPNKENLEEFYECLEELLEEVVTENKLIFIAGDLNIELKDNINNINRMNLLLNSYSFCFTVKEYTRITATSKSCIDNILTNFSDNYVTYVLPSSISDHTAQKIVFTIDTNNRPEQKLVRIFSEHNKIVFTDRLNEQNWSEVYDICKQNVNDQWNKFMFVFSKIFNASFPLKFCKQNTRKDINDLEIEESKRNMNAWLVVSNIHPEFKNIYNDLKNNYNSLLIRKRKENYETKILKSDNKMKCMWKIHNEVTGKSISNNSTFKGIPSVVANQYNNFLVNIVPELLDKLDKKPFTCSISNNIQSMFIKPITITEVKELGRKLKNKYTCGDDDIPISIVKLCLPYIAELICYIINNSFKYGIFPDQLKTALITPIYKKGDCELFENHRPISVLPSFSKIFEMAMCNRLMNFMVQCNQLNKFQHGYIKGRSVETAIFQFTETILKSLENNEILLGVFLDLSKAYDCLNHDFLLIKLERYGIRGNALEWFKSYLSYRQQKVKIVNDGKITKSSLKKCNSVGIPQGSITGPVLFVIFMNDILDILTESNDTAQITNYADDTNLLISGTSYANLVKNSAAIIQEADEWFAKNELILNVEKTNVILFRTQQLRFDSPNSIQIVNSEVTINENTKFLGVYINEYLKWDTHITYLGKKLNQICYSIKIICKYLNIKSIKIIYFANFEANARFGIIFWGSSQYIESVFLIQKRVVRSIFNLRYRQTCRGVFKKQQILTIYGLYIFECIMYLFKNKDKFVECGENHSYPTRSNDFSFPIHRLTLSEKHPNYMAIRLFNKLPNSIKHLQILNNFKRSLKNFLIDLEPYSVNDYLK